MATATKGSTSTKSSSRSSNGRGSTKRSTSASNSSRSRTKTAGRAASSSARKTSSSARKTTSSARKRSNGSAPKGRWSQLADKASKARVPLIAGGTAIASAAAGAAAHKFAESRSGANGKLGRLSSKLSPGKLDAEKIKSAGERLSALGQQTADIAGAIEKTRKKHK